MKKIVLFITNYKSNHKGFYDNLIMNTFKGIHVDLFVCEHVILNLEDFEGVDLHIRKERESLSDFLNTKREVVMASDMVVFEELYTFPIRVLLEIIRNKTKALLIVHNANKFFKRDLKFNIRSIIAYIFFKLIKYNVRGVIVISKTVKEYIVKNKLFNQNVYYIPFNDTAVDYELNIEPYSPIKFTIPGTVNTERRNYKIFLKVFLRILIENPEVKIKLCLLGKIVQVGKEEHYLIEQIRKINPEVIDMWDEFIDSEIYHRELSSSNFLIGNINVDYMEHNVKEIYGQSKETGVLFLMLQYKIRTLFPENYNFSKMYESYIITYKNKEETLYNTIFALINSKDEKKEVTLNTHSNYVKNEINKLHKNFLSAKN